MCDPLPLNPDSPDVEIVDERVGALLRGLYPGRLDAVIDAPLAVPNPVSIVWKDRHLDCGDASWVVDAGELNLELRRPRLAADEHLDEMFRVMNHPAEFKLDDGSSVTARLVHLVGRGNHVDVEKKIAMTTYTMQINSWTWWPSSNDVLWVGRLDRRRIRDGNLVVCGERWWTSTCYRLSGNYDLYVLDNGKKETTTLVVNTRGAKLDQSLLGTDFMAMEFAVGCPLRLDHVVAVDDHKRLVGAAGLEFGGWTSQSTSKRCPVAESLDLYANYEDASRSSWIPVLHSLVAQRLQEEGPDSALRTAVSAYLDSIAAGCIHVSYLLVQIALEALSADIVRPKSGVLVVDPKKWMAFVSEHENLIKSFAVDDEAARKLVNKVRSAQQAPSTGRVLAALEHFGLEVPPAVLEEVARRNSSAHRYVMAKESADVQELADRLALVQTLLVALVAKEIGFKGPIMGWEWIKGRHRIPDWWPWEQVEESRRMYMVLPASVDGASNC